MTEQQLTFLIGKYLSGEATEEEMARVEQWYDSFDESSLMFADEHGKIMNESIARSLNAIREKIAQQHTEEPPKVFVERRFRRNIHRWRAAAAAAVLIALSGSGYWLFFKTNKPSAKMVATTMLKKDFNPGGNNAVLTLANGKKIILDSVGNGTLTQLGNTKVIKLNNGLIAYNGQSSIDNRQSAVQYNMITTPRGGKYEVVLPDGTKVWLNAASSIRFPTAFTGNEREVQITGEAYFEVAKNPGMPFQVTVQGMEIKVLGTHFNVMAYPDETEMKTTLLEGAVKVKEGKNILLLKPGEAAQVNKSGDIRLDRNVNTDEAIAWKNNLFWFDNDNIHEVMRQLSRWYDVDIIIQGNIPDLFTGSIPQNLDFSKVFEVLQKTGSIQYKIENNKTIIVSP